MLKNYIGFVVYFNYIGYLLFIYIDYYCLFVFGSAEDQTQGSGHAK
jgi:hypothetical protein